MAALMDLVASAVSLYLSVWVYEIGNWVSLTTSGAKATVLIAGALPEGAVGLSTDGMDFGSAKLLQVILCSALAFSALLLLRRCKLPLTKVTIICIVSLYVTSIYWEILSLTTFVPILLHEAIYVCLSVLTAGVLLVAFSWLLMDLDHGRTYQNAVDPPSHRLLPQQSAESKWEATTKLHHLSCVQELFGVDSGSPLNPTALLKGRRSPARHSWAPFSRA